MCPDGWVLVGEQGGGGRQRGAAGPALTFPQPVLALFKRQPWFHGSRFYGCSYLTVAPCPGKQTPLLARGWVIA